MAWLSNWNRRKRLYLNGTNAGSQSLYQMRITVNSGTGTDSAGNIFCGGNVKSDFSDIRFTDTDGTTPLYYWIDQANTTASYATVWVKVPSVPTGSNSAYIYFYYNNPSAITASNGTNTFVFFDNFGSSSDLSNYTVSLYAGTGSGNISAIITSDYKSSPSSMLLQMMVDGGLTNFWILANRSLGLPNGTYEIDYWTKTVYGNQGTYATYPNYSYIQINGTSYNGQAGTGTYPSISWVYTGFTFTGSITTIGLYCTWRGFNGGPGAYYDDLRIRKYASPEPTWSSTISTEQGAVLNITSNPTGAEVWLRIPAGSGSYIDQGVTTNTTINVTPGTYDVELILSGGQTWYLLNQTFNAGNTYNIQATFTGQLFISSTPSGAEVWLSGYDWNVKTNTTITGLNPSPPDYNITLKLANYQDWIGLATVYSTLTTSVIATFAGSASITSTPSGAVVYLDGSPTPSGNTPLIIKNLTPATSDGSVPTQSHTYILRFTGYADTSGSFTATAGTTVTVTVTFPGSLYISSLPEGAQIFIDGILQ